MAVDLPYEELCDWEALPLWQDVENKAVPLSGRWESDTLPLWQGV